MNIVIVGTGYVGLTTGTCLAELGNSVRCLDIDKEKIEKLSRGECVIYEKGLAELLTRNLEQGRISFTTDAQKALKNAQIVFLALPTPEASYGKANLSFLSEAARTCAQVAGENLLFVNKSTAPVGTVMKLKEIIGIVRGDDRFSVASNPEFLSEGDAVNNFFHPDRVVIGVEDERGETLLRELYAPITDTDHPLVSTTIASAELIKYAANSFLALKISFINEIADFCESVGADVKEIARGIGYDKRIGSLFLQAGIGYGGSCFGKDVKALAVSGEERGFDFKIIKALSTVNDLRYQIVIKKLTKHFASLSGKKIAVLGLAYKPGTDDVRDSPAHRIVHELLAQRAHVTVYDPAANAQFKKSFSQSDEIIFAASSDEAAAGADAILILTAWEEFTQLHLAKIKEHMNGSSLIVDGRNIFDRRTVESLGFVYEGIGR